LCSVRVSNSASASFVSEWRPFSLIFNHILIKHSVVINEG
jgi:hypothetical protein